MLHSLAAQVSYYSSLIQSHPGWRYAGVYADEALTGTKDTREEFQRLLRDCRAGKIQMVITKSISRFARNTTDCIRLVRELSALGVAVRFEKEHIIAARYLGMQVRLALQPYVTPNNEIRAGTHDRFTAFGGSHSEFLNGCVFGNL